MISADGREGVFGASSSAWRFEPDPEMRTVIRRVRRADADAEAEAESEAEEGEV